MRLRPYQTRAVSKCTDLLQKPARVCLVMPTGAGKTVTAHAISRAIGARHPLWLVHRRELADQAPGRAVTIQSLLSGRRPDADLLIADECHHLAPAAAQWHAVARDYPRILGLTATPQRGDGSPLGDLFDHLVVGAQYSELLDGGWLLPARVYQPPEAMEGSALAQDPLRAWQRYAVGRGFAFFSRTELARKFVARAQAAGIRAAVVTGTTPRDERDDTIRRFRAGDIDILANVYILTEGVDVPEASTVMLARGVEHTGPYLQMVGRVLRPAPGKADPVVIDLTGATIRHGLPHVDREYSLSGRPITSRPPSLRTCLQCGAVTHASGPCQYCGWSPPRRPPRVSVWNLPLEAIDPRQLDAKQRKVLAARRRFARMSRQQRMRVYSELRARARARGYKPGWAAHQYRLRFGAWPPRSWG